MNHIYKTIWNAAKALWVCVSEATRSHTHSRQQRDTSPATRTITSWHPTFSAKRLVLAMFLGLGCISSLQASVQFFNYGEALTDNSFFHSIDRSSWLFRGFESPEIASLNIWSRYTGNQGEIPLPLQFSSAALYIKPTDYLSDTFRRLIAVGKENDYALDIRSYGSFSLQNTLVEGDIHLDHSTLYLRSDLESLAQNTSLHGTVFLNGSTVWFSSFFGNVWSAEATEATEASNTPLSVRFQSIDAENALYFDSMDNTQLDVDALAQIAGDGRKIQAFHKVGFSDTVSLINTFDLGTLKDIHLDKNNKLVTLNRSSSVESYVMDASDGPTLHVDGLIRVDGGETVDLSVLYETDEGPSTIFYGRNAVILGINDIFLANLGGDYEAYEADSDYSIAMENPQDLFSESTTPFWLTDKDRNTLTLALIDDISLTADQVNTIGGIIVRQGTTTLSGNVTKPVRLENNATLILTLGSQVNQLTGTQGTVVLNGGTVDVSNWEVRLLTLQLTDAPVTLTGNTSVDTLSTNASDMASLSAQLTAIRPNSVWLRSPINELNLETLSYIPYGWKFKANANVQGLPNDVWLLGDHTVNFTGGLHPIQHFLTNGGRVTYHGGVFDAGSQFFLTEPTASVTFMDGATLTVANEGNYLNQEPLFSVDHLNQIDLRSDTHFQIQNQDQELVSTSQNDSGFLTIETNSLGEKPSWWSTDFMTTHLVAFFVKAETLTEDEVAWLNASGAYPFYMSVKEASLGTLFNSDRTRTIFNHLTLTHTVSTPQQLMVMNSLTLNDGVALEFTGDYGVLAFEPGSRLVLGEGSTIQTDRSNRVRFFTSVPQAQHSFVVSIPGEAINETGDLTPFLSREQKSFTAIETRNDLTNVNVEKLNDYAAWIIKGNVTGVLSPTESQSLDWYGYGTEGWPRQSAGIGALVKPVEVASGASLSATWITPYQLLDVYGTVSSDYLMIADPTVADATRPSSAVIVHAGGTLEVKKQAYFNAGYSTSLNILTDGLLRADKEALIQSGIVVANTQYNGDRGLQTRQSGTWEPSFDSENRYDLTDDTGYELTKRFEKIVVTSPSSVTVSQSQTAAYSVAGTLVAKDGTTFENAVDVAGTLSLEGAVSFANANADTPWLTTLTLHPTSTLTLAEGASLTLGGSSIVTDAPVLASTDGAPSWWSTVQTALSASSREATLVTTAATSAVDASAFKRWEVRGVGDNIAQALPEETLIYAGKSLTLTMPQLDRADARELAPVQVHHRPY